MAEDSNRAACDACCRDAVPCAPRVRRTSILTRGALPALPARCVKSDRRRRRLYVAPRERRRDRRRARERALLPCVDPASRSCRDVELRAHKKRRLAARTRTSRRAVPERRDMATTRASSVCTRVHMLRMYTWPRTETNQRTNQATNQPARAVNKDNDIATTTTRPTPNHARHATPTPATPTPRASRSAENASLLCVFRKRLFLHCTFCVVIFFLSLSLSHLSPRTVSLPSFFEGLCFFLGFRGRGRVT